MSRKDFFDSLAHKKPAATPFFFSMCGELIDRFEQKHGTRDYADYYGIPIREVFLRPTRLDPAARFARYLKGKPASEVNEWGTVIERGSVAHFFRMDGPLRGRMTAEEAAALPFPDFLSDYRWDGVAEEIAALKAKDYVTIAGIYGDSDAGRGEVVKVPAFIDIFEASWYLCGLDEMLMEMYDQSDFALTLLSRMGEFKAQLARRWARAGVDILTCGDDVASQQSLMMSGDMWRSLLLPRLKACIAAAREEKPDIAVFYHSDGNISDIIPDLIDAGVDIINPVQPECMDPKRLSQRYGDKASFWGTIGTQTTMPFGSPDDVRRACEDMLSTVGAHGGLILAPTHLLEPDVSLENVEAFAKAVTRRTQP